MSQSAEEVLDILSEDLRRLREEAAEAFDTLVRAQWDQGKHFDQTLYAYLMAAFARVDLYSKLWRPDMRQTDRMRAFLQHYLGRDPLAHSIAVQLWRHTLMHTSRPRRIRERSSGREFTYLLQWGKEHLPLEHHYTVSGSKLTLGLLYLLDDLDEALTTYASDVVNSKVLTDNLNKAWPGIETQEFDL